MPIPFDLPTMVLLWPFFVTVVVYLWLRWGVWNAGVASPVSAARHTKWVGVLGWLVSSLQGAANAGTIAPGFPYNSSDTPGEIVALLSWPVLGVLLIQTIGQISYPGHKGTRRRASLSMRRIRNFLPRKLAFVTLGVFVFSACFIAWIAGLPSLPAVERIQTADGYPTQSGQPGRISGVDVAACLGGALLVLAVGTVLVLLLITRRRQLEGLSDTDNQRLRSIAMNRLLRTVATVASGLGAIAGNFAMNTPPGEPLQSFVINYHGILNLAVLLMMWGWAPPRLEAEEVVANLVAAEAGPKIRPLHPATRLVASLGPLLAAAAALPLIVAWLFSGLFIEAREVHGVPFSPMMFVALSALAVLGVIAAGEVLLTRNYTVAGLPRGVPVRAVSTALTTTAIVACVLLLSVLATTASGEMLLGTGSAWIEGSVCAGIVVAAVLRVLKSIRTRPGIRNAAGPDATYRTIAYVRTTRTLAAFFSAEAAVFLLFEQSAVTSGLRVSPASFPGFHELLSGAGVFLAVGTVFIALIPVRTSPRSRVLETEMDSVP